MPCYVLSCDEETVVGRRHKMYGLVDCCPGHDPERHGYGLELCPDPLAPLRRLTHDAVTASKTMSLTAEEIVFVKALFKQVGTPPDDGGKTVKVPPRVLRFPPGGATANGGRK